MKRKKLWSIMLVGMMTASLALAGCGSKSKSGETQKTDDGKIQIDFWYSGGKTAVNVLSDLVEEFNKSQDKYEIKGTTQADYTEKQALQGKTHRIWRFLTWINPEICIVRIKWQI